MMLQANMLVFLDISEFNAMKKSYWVISEVLYVKMCLKCA